jgi:hypothetical protein
MASGSDGSVSLKNTESSPERRGIVKLDSAVAVAHAGAADWRE